MNGLYEFYLNQVTSTLINYQILVLKNFEILIFKHFKIKQLYLSSLKDYTSNKTSLNKIIIFDSLLFEEYQVGEQLLINKFDDDQFKTLIDYLTNLTNKRKDNYKDKNNANYKTLTKRFDELIKEIQKRNLLNFTIIKRKKYLLICQKTAT